MLKPMLKTFLVFISITYIMYLFGSFYYSTFDIKYWSPEGKFSLLSLDGLCSLCYILINYLDGNYSKNEG